jgi:small-conductance mechanosensitive channel
LKYADKCPVSPCIPHYLVVAGAVGLIGIGLHMILHIHEIYSVTKSGESSSITKLVLNGVSVILLLIIIFLSGWFIAGCIWVFRVWNKVQYENPNEPDYCHQTLYRFTFSILLISIIYQLFSYFRFALYGYSLIRKIVDKKNKGGAIPVPTTEP